MAQGLSVSRLVSVTINLAPLAPARRGFGTLLILGDSLVINASERIRSYSGIEGVATDFGINAAEYKGAALYFGQSPRPRSLCIGRWVRVDSAALIKGAALTSTEQLIATWQLITTGSFRITIDGVVKTLSALDFSGAANLNAVATLITTALSSSGVCTWDGSSFIITSATTGETSTMSYATATGAGTDISALLKMTLATGLAPVQGYDAESPAEATAVLADMSSDWYGLAFCASVMPTIEQAIEVAALVQAFTTSRIYGVTETDTRVLDATYVDDIASEMMALGYTRTFTQYSPNVNAVCSFMGRAFSVNFNANRSTITMMYKQEPGINAELLTETQAKTLQEKRCNVFVRYDNDTSIIQYGVMSGPAWFDEIHGLDWLQNAIQNSVYTLLYGSLTKIPQTNAGSNQIVNEINSVCDEAVNNGLVAPGQWNQDGFGQIERGSFLKTGFYIFAQPMELQAQSERETRKAPPITVAVKLAGAIQEVDVIVNVNR